MKRMLIRLLLEWGLVLASVLAAIGVVMLGLWIAHYPPFAVLHDWAVGAGVLRADGSTAMFDKERLFNIAVDLKNACPLILTGLAAGVAFRSGVINIGGEGQMVIGALGAVAVATRWAPWAPGWMAIPMAILAAMLCGAAWAFIAAALDRWRGVPVVLSTILLNFIALKLMQMMLEGPLKDPKSGVPQSMSVGKGYLLPNVSVVASSFADFAARWHMPGVGSFVVAVLTLPSLHVGIFFALAVAAALWIIQARTTFGFELRVAGLNPVAARLAGMPVAARQFAVMMLSGGSAGMAGAVQLLGVTHRLSTDVTGLGYAGVGVALLGRLHPAGIVLAAVFFGMLDWGATNVEGGDYALPKNSADIVKGVIVLGILVGTAFLSRRRVSGADAPVGSVSTTHRRWRWQFWRSAGREH